MKPCLNQPLPGRIPPSVVDTHYAVNRVYSLSTYIQCLQNYIMYSTNVIWEATFVRCITGWAGPPVWETDYEGQCCQVTY